MRGGGGGVESMDVNIKKFEKSACLYGSSYMM